MNDLAGRHALVTGASRSLGRHIARALAAEGVKLTLAARSAADLETLGQELGTPAVAVPTDVTDEQQRRRLLEKAQSAWGPIDVLVNNAGVEYSSPYARQDPAEITQTLEVNLAAPLLLTRAVLPPMIERRGGHIVNISSASGKTGTPFEAAYSASKFGLVGCSQALRAELHGTGVGCSVICPGFIGGEGMYARMEAAGIKAPRLIGVSPIQKVAAAVVTAIKEDRAEVVVNPTPLRPLLALQQLAPGAQPVLMRALGVTDLFRRAAQGRVPA
jgi:short-subunit dehydrogenase